MKVAVIGLGFRLGYLGRVFREIDPDFQVAGEGPAGLATELTAEGDDRVGGNGGVIGGSAGHRMHRAAEVLVLDVRVLLPREVVFHGDECRGHAQG